MTTRKSADAGGFMLPIAKVKRDPKNENEHPAEQVEALKLSLEIFGQQKPILVDKKNVCIAGEGVLTAATALGWKEIECELCPLEGNDRAAYRLTDNTSARWSEWDFSITKANLDGLAKKLGPAFNWLAVGFTKAEVAALRSGGDLPARGKEKSAGLMTIKIVGVKGNHKTKVMRVVKKVLQGTGYEANAY